MIGAKTREGDGLGAGGIIIIRRVLQLTVRTARDNGVALGVGDAHLDYILEKAPEDLTAEETDLLYEVAKDLE